MKVLMFGWEFPPHISGGLGTACYGLTKALAKKDVKVNFVIPRVYGDEDKAINIVDAGNVLLRSKVSKVGVTKIEEFWKNVKFIEARSGIVPYMSPEMYEEMYMPFEKYKELFKIKKLNRIFTQEDIHSLKFAFSGGYGYNLFHEVYKYSIVASLLALENEFDVIHAHDWLTYPAGVAAKQVSGKPLVVHMHATEFDRSGEHVNQQVYDIERYGMEMADRVVTVSHLTRNIVIERYGINPDKVITIHNGVEHYEEEVEEAPAQKTVKEKIVTFLGRVTFQKGPDYFVEAAYKVLKKNDNVRFVMAGSGDMLNRMIKRVAQLGMSTRFHFTGFLRGNDVKKLLDMSDVYVMPSVSEPFGISPLEALQSNVPVIISKQSGVSEILNHAIKVDFWDINALADAMYGLLSYEALSRIFKYRGKKEVERLSWDSAAQKLKDVYFSLTK